MLPSNINNAFRAITADIREWFNDSQWVEYGDGDGAFMVWIFAAKQATYTAGGDTTTYDADVEKNSSSRSLESVEIVEAQDDTTAVESTLSESKNSSQSSGKTVNRGTETTSVIREYDVGPTADFSTKMAEVLSLANYEPIDYVDLVNECGGEEPEIVEEELALNGKMSRETRKSVITAARDCDCLLYTSPSPRDRG